ncbi:carboxymuconolactone decarboxylase family protein [Pelomonas sp. V22]|uniref:carboxymuconolactone decarboxylase family protein n=1 Tax=Pelomonas sp. V22 TaxID=2822139 RepID=UPI0024A9AE62|nr:carboxymuconolactone decarboxylase family protein [Pelomonas sp. V22]MDI4632112.1 carboxymuconolactone decarboxylase family protein [Pelomonas sp. V22]
MRIPDWSPELKPQPQALVDAIRARRGGSLINLDLALLWSEPLARGWNAHLKAVRSELGFSRELRELAICTVALLTGAAYEYHHHAPDYLTAGGLQATLDALQAHVASGSRERCSDPAFTALDALVVQYAQQMTLDVRVDDAVFEELRQRLDDNTALVELTSAIATYNMVARFLVALQITPENHDGEPR